MKDKLILLCFSWLCLLSTASSQETGKQQKWKYVVAPPEQFLVTVAYQPKCPLQFEEVKYLAGLDGGGSPAFIVRNKGDKPIRAFTVGSSGWTLGWSEKFTKKLLLPGERAFGDDDVEIVPLTGELRDKLKLNGPMRAVIVLMVIRVEYADGSVYSAESTYKALRAYSEDLSELKANTKP